MGYYNGNDTSETIIGLYEDDSIYGNGGDDTVRGSFGDDDLTGGTGKDTLNGEAQDDSLYGDEGDDTLRGGSGEDGLHGGAGGDRLLGGSGRDRIHVGSGGDLAGDRVDGGAGRDTLVVDFSLHGGGTFRAVEPVRKGSIAGFTYTSIEAFDITGSEQVDRLTTWRYDDEVDGGGADDVVNGGYGDDTLSGGSGDDDLLYGDDGRDILGGGAGGDHLNGNAGSDRLNGDAGNDILNGDTGGDTLSGGAGNDDLNSESSWDDGTEVDRLYGQGGNDLASIGLRDVASGGAGFDRLELYFEEGNADETWTLRPGGKTFDNGARVEGFDQLTYWGGSGREAITGGGAGDELHGGTGNDELGGGGGNDTLDGDEGNDTLRGGLGNDALHHDSGRDRLFGNAGNDGFDIDFDDEALLPYTVLVDGGRGWDAVDFIHDDLGAVLDLAHQERNDGLAYGKTFRGIERYEGTTTDDVMRGAGGGDLFFGGSGGDELNGRGGSDLLAGGIGSDVLTGGRGRDVFDFSDDHENWPVDTVTDFRRGQDHLRFDLGDLGFASARAVQLVNAAGATAVNGRPTLIYETDAHLLWLDTDGRGQSEGPELLVELDGIGRLSLDDFIFV